MIKNSEILARLSGFGFFYRWHPEVALRYLSIVDEVKRLEGDLTILEVGSGGLGIVPYLKREVTGVDLQFKPPFHPLLKRIKASAIKLPFEESSFDVVLSVDTLEHLEKNHRKKAISEMIRVAKRRVFIAVPCGKKASREDFLLAQYDKKRSGKTYPFCQEHLKYDLPEEEEVVKMIKIAARQNKKAVGIIVKGNENIKLHRFLLKGYMTKNFLVDFFFRKILLFAIPIMRYMNREPSYRKMFFVDVVPAFARMT